LNNGAILKIHELTNAAGALVPICLCKDENGALCIADDEGRFRLPEGALEAVMTRYGAPVDESERIAEIATFTLAPGRTLRHVRHLAGYDVVARDYIILDIEGETSLCVMATTVAGALEHLARALHQRA
jgi:hypothetical protein